MLKDCLQNSLFLLLYYYIKIRKRDDYIMKNAKIFLTLDVSGSMGRTKKQQAKILYNAFHSMLKSKYRVLRTVSIAHCTTAFRSNPNEIFDIRLSGGTYLSSGISEIKKSHLCNGKNYLLIFSDGDNWGEDNGKFIKKLIELSKLFDNILFFEIKLSTYTSSISDLILNKKNEGLLKNMEIVFVKHYSLIENDDNNDSIKHYVDYAIKFNKIIS